MGLVDETTGLMKGEYPELVEHAELITRIVESEEDRFGATLRQGLAFLDEAIAEAQAAGSDRFDGDVAFQLHDTYGFPVELTSEIVAERGFEVDMHVFEREMEAQRERGRAAVSEASWEQSGEGFAAAAAATGEVDFVGYEKDETAARIVAMVVDGAEVETADAGAKVDVVLDTTPFYAEQGGQVGDTGRIETDSGAFSVEDTWFPMPGVVAHHGEVAEGTLRVGDPVSAAIDHVRRERIRRNHTATHLLHWALRLVLGEHVRQAGSLVAPDRLRFDFTHFEAVTSEQLAKIERLVNAKIMENHRVLAYETSLASAREAGVTALFGEKYGDFVRVLEVGNFSKELCGGTHVARTSEIGLLKIAHEGSIGANLRRIEAMTSFDAMDAVYAEEDVLSRAAEALRTRPDDVADKAQALVERTRDAEKALEDLKRKGAAGGLDELVETAIDVGYRLVVARVDAGDAKELRDLSDVLRAKLGGGAVVLAAESDGKALLLAAGSDDAVEGGFDAGGIVREIAPIVGGRGGGRPPMAQAGGDDPARIEEALAAARDALAAASNG
jgi:alanyl-tRNA synthetase